MGILKNIFGAYSKKAAETSVDIFTKLDPDTASDVQIRQYEDEVNRRSELVTNSKKRVDDLTSSKNEIESNIQKLKTAIKSLMDKEQTDDIKKAIEDGLTQAESYKSKLEKINTDIETATSNYENYKKNHEAAVQRWMEAKDNFARIKERNQALTEELNSAKEAAHDAKVSAGLDSSINSSTIIQDAMSKQSSKIQREIDSLKNTTNVINSKNSTNSILEDAIKETTSPKTSSFEDRLNNL